MSARIEVVRGDAGWFGRVVARNGRELLRTSEVYTQRSGVVKAIKAAAVALAGYQSKLVGIVDVDERTKS